MSIPEETIMQYLNQLLSSSESGDSLHHLYVAATPAEVGPLGLPAETELTVYAIAPTDDVDAQQFFAKVIAAAGVDHAEKRKSILFAGLSQEAWTVESRDDLARSLMEQGRLFEHPDAAEVTIVYGVCRDGRRWRGERWVTGPKAGQTANVELLVGRPDPQEGYGMGPLMRALVGMAPWPATRPR